MRNNLKDIFPTQADLLALEPEQLAGYLLALFNSGNTDEIDLVLYAETQAKLYGDVGWVTVARAIAEAWQWLVRECFVALDPYQRTIPRRTIYFVTRRGTQIQTPADLDSFINASRLPRQILHPKIQAKVLVSFATGDYDTAVFQAFKEVEVSVRKKTNSPDSDLGVNLMKKSFNPDNGPLTDKGTLSSEREALMFLFAGAIGSYKNPCSHRHVSIDASQAIEMIMLASHLMNIIDSRIPAP